MLLLPKKATAKNIFCNMIFEWKLYILHYTCYYTGTFQHSYALLVTQIFKRVFMKLTTFFISKTKQIYATTLTVPDIKFKIKRMVLFEILLMLAVIWKQRFLHQREIMQYLQNCKYQDVNQSHFRKSIQAFASFK